MVVSVICLVPRILVRVGDGEGEGRAAYRDFEVNHLVRDGAHLVVEAEAVLARLVRSEDKVALALVRAVEDGLVVGADDRVVDVEGAAGLDL